MLSAFLSGEVFSRIAQFAGLASPNASHGRTYNSQPLVLGEWSLCKRKPN